MLLRLARFPSAALALVLIARAAAAATTIPPGDIGTQTWTPAGSPYVVTGDITVPTGATLTIQAGAVVQFPGGDASNGGIVASETELSVAGTLLVQGTWSTPVTFGGQTGTGVAWYGIVAASTAAASITGAVIGEAHVGISGSTSTAAGGLLAVSQTLIQNSVIGMQVGDAVISEVRVSGTSDVGISFRGSGSISNSIVDHCASGISTASAIPGAALIVENSVLDGNATEGLINMGSAEDSVTLVNDLITNNAYAIVTISEVSLSVSYCDLWNNKLGNGIGFSVGTDSIAADPLYVSAIDYHLRAGSPAIDTGTSVGAPGQDFDLHPRPQDGDGVNGAQFDQGAYEYESQHRGTGRWDEASAAPRAAPQGRAGSGQARPRRRRLGGSAGSGWRRGRCRRGWLARRRWRRGRSGCRRRCGSRRRRHEQRIERVWLPDQQGWFGSARIRDRRTRPPRSRSSAPRRRPLTSAAGFGGRLSLTGLQRAWYWPEQ